MPIAAGPVSFVRFRVLDAPPIDPKNGLGSELAKGAFSPLDRETADEERAAGFVEWGNRDGTAFSPASVVFGDDILLGWRVDVVRVPAAQTKEALAEWSAQFESKHGRKPTGREKREEKEVLLRGLRKQAFVASKVHDVRWRRASNELQVWATATRLVEEVAVAVEDHLKLRLAPLGPGPRWEEGGRSVEGLGPTPLLFSVEVLGAAG